MSIPGVGSISTASAKGVPPVLLNRLTTAQANVAKSTGMFGASPGPLAELQSAQSAVLQSLPIQGTKEDPQVVRAFLQQVLSDPRLQKTPSAQIFAATNQTDVDPDDMALISRYLYMLRGL